MSYLLDGSVVVLLLCTDDFVVKLVVGVAVDAVVTEAVEGALVGMGLVGEDLFVVCTRMVDAIFGSSRNICNCSSLPMASVNRKGNFNNIITS